MPAMATGLRSIWGGGFNSGKIITDNGAGNVGIGTASPAQKLVAGTAQVDYLTVDLRRGTRRRIQLQALEEMAGSRQLQAMRNTRLHLEKYSKYWR